MELLCPGCRTPLPVSVAAPVVTCATCALEIDVTRQPTVAGKPRFVAERSFTGERVGEYLIGDRLGAGGMGTVYRATPAATPGREVAIKFIAPALLGDPTLLARFRREVALLGELSHPAIVKVLDHGEHDGVPWFAMDLVVGPTLRERLRTGPIPAAEALAVFRCVLDGLAYAHGRGVVHRDLKPANVLLADGGARVADFGVAHLESDGSLQMTALTQTAAILGTIAYMSPEQRAGRGVDRRSDLFSVGVMLYEALTGRLPQGAFAPPSRLAPPGALTPRIDAVITRLLQPEPADRFENSELTVLALTAALDPRARRRKVVLPITGAAAALAGTLLFWTFGTPATLSKTPNAATSTRVEYGKATAQPAAVTEQAPVQQAVDVRNAPPFANDFVPGSKASQAKIGKARPAAKKSAGLPTLFKTVQYQKQSK